ncbi:B-cell receptor CD22-like [Anolis sagrei]|uniref:B-cell receptor CD22-like n=1 Tax=Anolis sagrei TaxID=38937 RepID=UPI003520F88F
MHGCIMWCFLWMFFFEGVLCVDNPLVISPNILMAWKGSCVLIPCQIELRHPITKLNNISLIWWYNPVWIPSLEEFNGTMLYNGSTTSVNYTNPASPLFQDRVRFTGDLHNGNCSLKISQVQESDTGIFGARLYGFVQHRPKILKWFLNTTITVSDLPPRPKITFNPQQIQEKTTTCVTCSVSYHCPDEPVMVILTGLEKGLMIAQKVIERDRVVQTELTFTPTWKDHRKQLTCLLKSHNGIEISQHTVELDVKYAPQGVQLTATPSITVREGMKLSLKCLVKSSNPAVSYQWKKNNAITNNTDDKIEFSSVQEEHSGRYKCTAQNELGDVESNELSIDVQYPPKEPKVQCPSCGNFKEKSLVVLQCSSKGNPPIRRYEWFKRSEPSKISMQKELRFEKIQPSDSNTYFCKAYNGIGDSTSLPFMLDVQYGPKNVRIALLNPFPIKEDDTITFNCSVGSSNPKTNKYKLFNSDVAVKSNMMSNLITFPAKAGPITYYKCEACNDIACTQSSAIAVDVHFAPKDVRAVRQPSGLIDEGSTVNLSCEVGRANPQELTYIWYKDTDEVVSEMRILTIQQVTSRASGNYHCKAKNSVDVVSSSAVLLDVRYGPRDVHVSLNLQEAIIEGKDVFLQCKNTANPSANIYKWYWNGEEMAQKNTPVLELRKVQVGQSGDYSCQVSNQVAEGQSQPLALIVSYSRATVLKRSLIGLGTVLAVIALLGLLAYVLWRRKKNIDSDTDGTQRSGSFFVKKAKGQKLCNNNNRENEVRADGSVGFLNQGSEGSVTYATVQFRSNFPDDRVVYASINQPKTAVEPSDASDIYSMVKKPGHSTKRDTKHDYENVDKMEEELHYSSLVNLAPRPGPTYVNSETESESEDSIQYASLKH